MNIVKATSFITAALLAAGSNAAAQDTPAPSPMVYLRPVTFPVLAPVPEPQEQAAPQQPASAPAPAASASIAATTSGCSSWC